ncbi:MAG: hypothetical protein EOR00_22245 [Mesorhizobium sp.]|uniref:hypothetical protein n=1 Tax=Mesorhizobium sp. TaxID=1871066 RepID=UPI000FE5C448|nr:hypothetical protein [Mesorhizobium sp.]RWP14932.1 MAG: hypothetical protein EOR00_22245 [Mesorhizobium sp.]
MVISYIDELKKLEKEEAALAEKRAKLRESAKTEAMKKVEEAIADLNALGFNYRITDVSGLASRVTRGPARAKGATGTGKGAMAVDKVCPICEYRTDPPHDARRHRHQPEGQKKPFSADELAQLGLKRVG